MSRLLDILRGWGRLSPEIYLSESHDFNTLRMGLSCGKTTARGATATVTGRGYFNIQFISWFFTKVCNTMIHCREQQIPWHGSVGSPNVPRAQSSHWYPVAFCLQSHTPLNRSHCSERLPEATQSHASQPACGGNKQLIMCGARFTYLPSNAPTHVWGIQYYAGFNPFLNVESLTSGGMWICIPPPISSTCRLFLKTYVQQLFNNLTIIWSLQ